MKSLYDMSFSSARFGCSETISSQIYLALASLFGGFKGLGEVG